jgi:hypothetical protein
MNDISEKLSSVISQFVRSKKDKSDKKDSVVSEIIEKVVQKKYGKK